MGRTEEEPGALLTPSEFVTYVDAFLRAEKLLVGADQPQTWGTGTEDGGLRVKLPLEIDGEQRGESVIIDAFPNADPPTFYFMVVVEQAVCRLDFDPPWKVHPNTVRGSFPIPSIVNGHHYHSWPYNRGFFETYYGTKPVKLRNAEPLDPGIRSFDSALRWFCRENNITIGALGFTMPGRTRLI